TQIIEIRQLIREVARDTTVILSSHILTEVQAVCSRILVLHRGRLVADDTGEGLAEKVHGKSRVTARARGAEDEVLTALRRIPGLLRLESLGARELGTTDFACEGAEGRDLRVDVFEALAAAGLPLLYTYGSECSLEEVFLRVIDGDAGGERT
ncbi:MAG: ABC transporter, partial [Clostridiales bacterium]|nr:ABC transporter [Clostridiales bacterium]